MQDYEDQAYLRHLTEKSRLWYQDVLEQILSLKPKRVLELGCGDGGLARLLAEERIKVLALDNSQTFLNYARRCSKSKLIKYKKANLDDARGLDISERCFDLVVSVDVIEHLRRKERLFKDISGILDEGGYLVLQVPNLYSNLISKNYVHRPKNLLIKLGRGIKGAWRQVRKKPPEEILKVEYGLDYRFADHDALWLSSPFWYINFFRQNNWKLLYFTSFSFDSEKAWLKKGLRLLGCLPLIRYLGGRMVMLARFEGKPVKTRRKRVKA